MCPACNRMRPPRQAGLARPAGAWTLARRADTDACGGYAGQDVRRGLVLLLRHHLPRRQLNVPPVCCRSVQPRPPGVGEVVGWWGSLGGREVDGGDGCGGAFGGCSRHAGGAPPPLRHPAAASGAAVRLCQRHSRSLPCRISVFQAAPTLGTSGGGAACWNCRLGGATANHPGLLGLTLHPGSWLRPALGTGRWATQGTVGGCGVAVSPDRRRSFCGVPPLGGAAPRSRRWSRSECGWAARPGASLRAEGMWLWHLASPLATPPTDRSRGRWSAAACALRARCVCAACALRVRCVCAACALRTIARCRWVCCVCTAYHHALQVGVLLPSSQAEVAQAVAEAAGRGADGLASLMQQTLPPDTDPSLVLAQLQQLRGLLQQQERRRSTVKVPAAGGGLCGHRTTRLPKLPPAPKRSAPAASDASKGLRRRSGGRRRVADPTAAHRPGGATMRRTSWRGCKGNCRSPSTSRNTKPHICSRMFLPYRRAYMLTIYDLRAGAHARAARGPRGPGPSGSGSSGGRPRCGDAGHAHLLVPAARGAGRSGRRACM